MLKAINVEDVKVQMTGVSSGPLSQPSWFGVPISIGTSTKSWEAFFPALVVSAVESGLTGFNSALSIYRRYQLNGREVEAKEGTTEYTEIHAFIRAFLYFRVFRHLYNLLQVCEFI